MADTGIPPGLTLRKTLDEVKLFDNVTKNTKDLAANLAKQYASVDFLAETQKKFQKHLNDDIAARKKEHEEYLLFMEQQGYSKKEIESQQKQNLLEIEKLRNDALKEYNKTTAETQQNIDQLKKDVDQSILSYKDFQERMFKEVAKLKEAGASSDEIAAYLKKNEDVYQEASREMIASLDHVKDGLADLAKNENFDEDTRFQLKKQLRILEKSYDLEEFYFNKQYKIFEGMNEDLNRLRESQEEADKKEKRQQKGKFKDTLLTTMLGPFRLLTDPISRMLNSNRGTFEQFQHKTEQKDEKLEIYEKSRIQLNKLAEEDRENARLEALISGADASEFEKPSAASAGMKALGESFTPKAFLTGLKESLGIGEISFDAYFERANRQDAKDALYKEVKSLPKAILKGLITRGTQEHESSPVAAEAAVERGSEISPATAEAAAEPLALASPVAAEAAVERGSEISPVGGEPENHPLLNKISPDQNSLLAKGGVVGAGVVFLAKKLGLITDVFEDAEKKDKDEGGLGKTAADFVKKNGLGLLKAAAPLAVTALGGVMVAKGLEMQKRDTEDANKYFDEGNTARGVETLILGDRARVTEETANQELGRTAGKSALAAGGAGLVAAGGAGTAAMLGTVASAGGLAAAGGLGAVGTAGITAMGAVLPPALIAAAVVTAGMVVAKGTQEAFELGWDKNQAAIQKELTDTMLSEDSTTIEKIKAGAGSVWKGFTGSLAGSIREAGKVLDAETMIQNEKQINYIKEQAEAGSESHQRLLEMMQSEQFNALSDAEQKSAMQAEGLYDEFRGAQETFQKTLGEHLVTAGRTIGGLFSGLVDTTMEGMQGRETAVWEKAALKGMENMSGEDVTRLQQSGAYQEAMANGGGHKKAMESAYLAEAREKAIARGDLREDGMAVQEGNWLAGMSAGAAAGGVPGAAAGALGGAVFGKYLGFGDTGRAYKKKQSDEEYRQTFEYSKRKTELLGEGMTAEEADLAAIEEQNILYERARTLRLKQSADYKKEFDKQLKEGKSIKQAEEAALRAAKENKRNIMTTTELVKDKFREVGKILGNWAGNIGGFFKETFSEAGENLAGIGNMIKEGAKDVWNAVSEWFSGIWRGLGDKVRGMLGAVSEGWDWVKDKAGEGLDWVKGLFSGEDDPVAAPAKINDGIVTKDGRVIEVSPDDNIYATKNEFKSARDKEAQAAMPDVPRAPAEFTDAGIIAAIQALTDVLRNKELTPTIISPGESVNFDQFRMADVLA
jgi:hypothetical protein